MEIKTPEDLLGVPRPKIAWHHGTCDCCKRRLTLVLHLGYDTQPDRDYRLCLACLHENAQDILYGWMRYKVDDTKRQLYDEGSIVNENRKNP